MRGSTICRLFVLVVGALALGGLGGAQALAVEPGAALAVEIVPSASTVDFDPGRLRGSGEIGSTLATTADEARSHGVIAGVRAARSQGLDVKGARVRVVVEGSAGARDAIEKNGGLVEARSGSLTQALVPVMALRSLAASPAVLRVRSPLLARVQSTRNEAVRATNAGRLHAAGNLG